MASWVSRKNYVVIIGDCVVAAWEHRKDAQSHWASLDASNLPDDVYVIPPGFVFTAGTVPETISGIEPVQEH